MDQSQITDAIRRGIREPSPVAVASEDIVLTTLRGVTVLGLKIKEVDASFFNTRKSVASNTHVFDKPSDFILKVWDLGTTAKTITGAADNGSGAIRITSASHGFDDDGIICQHDVAGTTEANGTFKVENAADDTYDLVGSTFSNTYTSGGKAFVDPSDPDEIRKINLAEATLSSTDKWYPRDDKIIVDDNSFSNDILVDYIDMPDAIADIPSTYHEWLVSFGTLDLIRIPRPDAFDYADKVNQVTLHSQRLIRIENDVNRTLKASTEPEYIRDDFFNV